jgi:hypothetical protein
MLEKCICERCGKKFYRDTYYLKKSKHHYCCITCAFPSMLIEKKCLNCGTSLKGLYKKKFCSRSCAAIYNNKARAIEKCCLICGGKLKENARNYCSRKCYNISQKRNTIERFLKGELNDVGVRCDTIRQYLIELQGGCAICGSPPLHNNKPIVFVVDHADGNITNNSPTNIRAICPNCNSQTDTFTGKNVGKNTITRWNTKP